MAVARRPASLPLPFPPRQLTESKFSINKLSPTVTSYLESSRSFHEDGERRGEGCYGGLFREKPAKKSGAICRLVAAALRPPKGKVSLQRNTLVIACGTRGTRVIFAFRCRARDLSHESLWFSLRSSPASLVELLVGNYQGKGKGGRKIRNQEADFVVSAVGSVVQDRCWSLGEKLINESILMKFSCNSLFLYHFHLSFRLLTSQIYYLFILIQL